MLDVLGTYCFKNSANFSNLHNKSVYKGSFFTIFRYYYRGKAC